MAGCGAGVPLAAGVPGVESEAFSALEAAAGRVPEVAGDPFESLTGESSFREAAALGSKTARSRSGGTVRVMKPGDDDLVALSADLSALSALSALSDLRRSLAAVAVLPEGAMAATM